MATIRSARPPETTRFVRMMATNHNHIMREWPDSGLPPRLPLSLPISRARERYFAALDAEQMAHSSREKQQAVMGMYEDLASNFFIPAMFRLAFVSAAWGYVTPHLYWMEQALSFGHPFCYLHVLVPVETDPAARHAFHREYIKQAVLAVFGRTDNGGTEMYRPTPERERMLLARIPTDANERQDAPALAYIYAWFIEHGLLDPLEGETVTGIYQRAAGTTCFAADNALARIELQKEDANLELAKEILFRTVYQQRDISGHNADFPEALFLLGYAYYRAKEMRAAHAYIMAAANLGFREARWYAHEILLHAPYKESALYKFLAAIRGHPLAIRTLPSGFEESGGKVLPHVENGVFYGDKTHYEDVKAFVGEQLYNSVVSYDALLKRTIERESEHLGGMAAYYYPHPDIVRYVLRSKRESTLFRLGWAAEKAGDLKEAIRLYKESAILEAHPHAMYCLATLLRPSDANAAEELWDPRMYWLQNAAVLHGHPFALKEFCDAFTLGEGLSRNPNEAAYYRQRLAEYGRFRIERDLDAALRNAEAIGLISAESAFLLAWFQSVTGSDCTDALRFAVDKGHAGAKLTLTMNALATSDDLMAYPNVLDMAYTGKKTDISNNVDRPIFRKELEAQRDLKEERSDRLPSGAAISARKARPTVRLKHGVVTKAWISRHVNAMAELSARGYWPALLCSIALCLSSKYAADHTLDQLSEAGCLSALAWRGARVGQHLCRKHGAEAAAILLRSAAMRHPSSLEALARLCDRDCFLTPDDAFLFRLRAAKLQNQPSQEALAEYYTNAKPDPALRFYWRALTFPNRTAYHLSAEIRPIKAQLAEAFAKYGNQEYLPLLYAVVTDTPLPVAPSPSPAPSLAPKPTLSTTSSSSHSSPAPSSIYSAFSVTGTLSPMYSTLPVAANSSSPNSTPSASGLNKLPVVYLKPAPTASPSLSATPSPPPNPAAPRTQLPIEVVSPAPLVATANPTPNPAKPAPAYTEPRKPPLTLGSYALPSDLDDPPAGRDKSPSGSDKTPSARRSYTINIQTNPKGGPPITWVTPGPIVEQPRAATPTPPDTPAVSTTVGDQLRAATPTPGVHLVPTPPARVVHAQLVPADDPRALSATIDTHAPHSTSSSFSASITPPSSSSAISDTPSSASTSSADEKVPPKIARTESKTTVTEKETSKLVKSASKPKLEKIDSKTALLRGSDPKGSSSFKLETFLEFADISGLDAIAFTQNAERERLDTEDVLLRLSNEELNSLGLSRLGDRKRYISAAQKWQESHSGSRLPECPILRTEEVSVIEPPLGTGNFAAVYHGTFSAAPVALKVLFNVKGDEEEFWKEAKTLHDLSVRSHPNVLRFFGLCKLETPVSGWAFVTEYMSNGSLKDFLVKNGANLKLHQLYAFARKAAAGMLHLSNQVPPILHRDLGARNLLVGELDEREGTYSLRVADFGLARLSDSSGEYIVHGASPARWTAPEVWKERKHTVAADVYSFGITLWEIFTKGLRPFEELDDRTVVRRVRDGYKLPISHGDRVLPNELHALMLDCCATDASARPSWVAIHNRLQLLEVNARKPNVAASEAPSHISAPLHASSPSGTSSGSESDSGGKLALASSDPLPLPLPAEPAPAPAKKPAAATPTLELPVLTACTTLDADSYLVAAKSPRNETEALMLSLLGPEKKHQHEDGSEHLCDERDCRHGQSHNHNRSPSPYDVHRRDHHSNSKFDHKPAGMRSYVMDPAPLRHTASGALPPQSVSAQAAPPVGYIDHRAVRHMTHDRLDGRAACCPLGHPVQIRHVDSMQCNCGNLVQDGEAYVCLECDSKRCLQCVPREWVVHNLPEKAAKLIDDAVEDPSLRHFWKEVCASCSHVNFPNDVSFILNSDWRRQSKHLGALTCWECKQEIAKETPFVWVRMGTVWDVHPMVICPDCMWPKLINEPGIPSKAFARVMQRLGAEQSGQAFELWYLYTIHVVIYLCGDLAGNGSVTLPRFARVVAWFGPVERRHFLIRAAWLFSRMWFFGDISSADATKIAEQHGVQGAWLLRFSTTELGGFAFTVLTKEGRVTHYRVTRNARHDYVMRVNGVDETFGSMSALLDGAYRLLRLKQPITSSPLDVFRSITKAAQCQGDVSYGRSSFMQHFDATGWNPPTNEP